MFKNALMLGVAREAVLCSKFGELLIYEIFLLWRELGSLGTFVLVAPHLFCNTLFVHFTVSFSFFLLIDRLVNPREERLCFLVLLGLANFLVMSAHFAEVDHCKVMKHHRAQVATLCKLQCALQLVLCSSECLLLADEVC